MTDKQDSQKASFAEAEKIRQELNDLPIKKYLDEIEPKPKKMDLTKLPRRKYTSYETPLEPMPRLSATKTLWIRLSSR